MGQFLFWIIMLVQILLAIIIICCAKNYGGKREKRPIWFIIVTLIVACIPIAGIILEPIWMFFENEEERVYYDTFLNKKI